MRVGVVVLCFAALVSQGCLSAVGGTYCDVECTSEPSGAAVSLAGVRGVTPCTLHVRRGSAPRMVTFALEGYEGVQQEVVPADRRFGAGFYALAFLDGLLLLPAIVDLCLYERVAYEWPLSVRATLREVGRPGGSIWVERDPPEPIDSGPRRRPPG